MNLLSQLAFQKVFPTLRDFSIAVVIAFFTTEKFGFSDLIYKATIFTLVLIIAYIFFTSLDKYSKRLEMLSVVYCESFIRVVLDKFDPSKNDIKLSVGNLDDKIGGMKIFIVLPTFISEVAKIKQDLDDLQSFPLSSPNFPRPFHVQGKIVDGRLLIFDSPNLWSLGLEFIAASKKKSERQVNAMLKEMNKGIKSYTKRNFKDYSNFENLHFIRHSDLKMF